MEKKTIAGLVRQNLQQWAEAKPKGISCMAAKVIDRYISCHFQGRPFSLVDSANLRLKDVVQAIRKNGYYAIPSYLTDEQCAHLRECIDFAIRNKPEYVHPATKYDTRIHGIEAIDSNFLPFSNDKFLEDVASSCLGATSRAAFTLGARLDSTPNNPGSGGGWHRDSPQRQIKAMVYLSNTEDENGPFQFISGSEKIISMLRDDRIANKEYGSVRWTGSEVDKVLKKTDSGRLITFTAKAGTVLIFDSSAIHRGSPIIKGTRYALTNYYYKDKEITNELYEHFSPVCRI